jgi:sulfite reductase (NADPH) flavoprotein alpha-component
MFKKIFFQIHWFLGISAGLILSLMGITGAIYSYDQQILRWINTESYVVQAAAQPKLTPQQLYQHFSQKDANLKINSITISSVPTESSMINVAKEGARRGQNLMVNPYTAALLPEVKGQRFFLFIMQLHRNLTVGEVGKQLTGACTLMLIYFVLSGLYLRWPKKHSLKQWLFVKPKLKGRNFIWDLHAVVGTWVIVFYLVFACTGLYWSYGWWRTGMYAVLGVERPQNSGGPGPMAANRQAPDGTPRRPGQDSQMRQDPSERAQRPAMAAPRSAAPTSEVASAPTAEQISQSLQQTWIGFNRDLGRHYSSATFTLPKELKGSIEISFFDQQQQHERARNTAVYNYQQQKFEKLSFYSDKALNEKIMSSMLPVHRGSFMGPVYHFLALLASLAMPVFFVTGWMLYLKRRKQKRLTLAARGGASSPQTAATDPTQQWTIVYASQTGMAEQAAYNTSTSLQHSGLSSQVLALKDTDIDSLLSYQQVLFVVSTYGTGEAPDLASSFVKNQMSKSVDLSAIKFAVLALGSKEYPETYCLFGHQLFNWLKLNQAQPIFNIVEVDNGHSTDLARWFTALSNITHKEVQALINTKVFDEWQLLTRRVLNPGSLGQPAFELCLKPLAEQIWQAGDIAEIQAGNSDAVLDSFIKQHQLEPSAQLLADLRYKDLWQPAAIDTTQADWLSQLTDLPTREYSIASIPEEGQLQLVVRQKQLNDGLGLGSGWLTAHSTVGQNIAMRIRSNPSFHLISDNRPLILIGNGTGIAGLLSLLKQREQHHFQQNWLIFGERNQGIDHFYQQQIEQWLENGHLRHADLAFSRDQAQRIYVHHKLREQQQRLIEWIAQDALIYVCGSIQGMASDVDQALQDILGSSVVEELRQHERYRRDVY